MVGWGRPSPILQDLQVLGNILSTPLVNCHFPPQGIFLTQGSNPVSSMAPALQADSKPSTVSSWHSSFTPVLTLMASEECHVTYSFVLINRERLLFHPVLTSGILLCSCFRDHKHDRSKCRKTWAPCVSQKAHVPAGGAILSPWTCAINVSCVLLLPQVFLQRFWLINLFFYGFWIVSHSWKDLATLRLQRYSSVFSSKIQRIEFWHRIFDPVIVCINLDVLLYLWYSQVFPLSYLSRVLTAPISQSSLLCHLFSVFLHFCIFCSYLLSLKQKILNKCIFSSCWNIRSKFLSTMWDDLYHFQLYYCIAVYKWNLFFVLLVTAASEFSINEFSWTITGTVLGSSHRTDLEWFSKLS